MWFWRLTRHYGPSNQNEMNHIQPAVLSLLYFFPHAVQSYFHVNEWILLPVSFPNNWFYEMCNSHPHLFLCYWWYRGHLTLWSDRSKDDLWLCSWMVAREREVLSHCLAQLIFTQDKASFINFLCQCFIGLSLNGWAMIVPQFSVKLEEVRGQMCRTAWRRKGTGSFRVRTRKLEGRVDEK